MNARRAPRILFVHNSSMRFVRQDLEHLRAEFEVTECRIASRLPSLGRVLAAVRSHDLVFGWFASWHTYLPLVLSQRLRRPSILEVGGYDIANLPQIGYGSQRGGLKRLVSRRTMRAATALITPTEASRQEAIVNARVAPDRIRVVYHGIDDLIGADPTGIREPVALTVGNVSHESLLRKGHGPFAQASALVPELQFILAGRPLDDAGQYLRGVGGPNLKIAGAVDDAELKRLYQSSAVYVQPSGHEAFGMAVAEAMLGGCVPVVTRACGLPEVAGDCGVYVDSQEPAAVAAGIRQSLNASHEDRIAARRRVLDMFPPARRHQSLIDLVRTLT